MQQPFPIASSAIPRTRAVSTPHNHAVQFYEDENYLVDSVAKYFCEGLKSAGAAIFIATEEHRNAVEKELEAAGLDLATLGRAGRYFALDAAETLSRFMIDGCPSPELFKKAISPVLAGAEEGGRKVRAFGEMVAVLWKDGNREAAVRLEELWNDIAETHSFELLCAYPMKGFEGGCHSEGFEHVCAAHSHVTPTETFGGEGSEEKRLRAIALLQQKAISLEMELAKRRAAEDELCDFLENATEAIHKVSEEGLILWANKAEMDLLGYAPEEYIGQPVTRFHADAEVIADIFRRLKRGEQLKNYEARLVHKDGSIRVVAINSSVYWQGEEFRYTRCFSRDITATKRHTELLEQTVAKRTVELTEKVGELEAFSYSVSHDLRSPLRAMQGYAKSLLQDYQQSLDAEGIQRLERIYRSSERLDALVRDVLCYSKVSQGNFDTKSVSLLTLVRDVIATHPTLEMAGARISVGKLHDANGNEAYLAQCFTNLLDNGLKFSMVDRPSQVKVWSEVIGEKVRVNVSDDGIGIAPEHHDRVFEMFGRVYSDKTYEGTGIGLAIVKKAVNRMGGEIGFESEYGRGTRFWFTLPAA
jgi:PAS domain S-box-containing protein